MSLIAPLDQSTSCMTARSRVLQVLSRCETVNNIVALLSINFHQLELDVKREQQMRQKPGAGLTDSVLISALTSGPSLEFERSDATRKLRLVLSELLTLMYSPSTSSVPLGELLTTLSLIIRVWTELILYSTFLSKTDYIQYWMFSILCLVESIHDNTGAFDQNYFLRSVSE